MLLGLRDLVLDRNHLTGSLPGELEHLKSLGTALQHVFLPQRFEGIVILNYGFSLCDCPFAELFDISRNLLEGTLPEWFGLTTLLGKVMITYLTCRTFFVQRRANIFLFPTKETVDIIESGISGPVPESYCEYPELLADRVIIGNCEGGHPMIPNCTCCDRVALRVSWCVEDFPKDALGEA